MRLLFIGVMLRSMGYRKGQSAMETLLNELCVDLGFCLPPEQKARVERMPTDDVDAFARALFTAEGLTEPYDRHLCDEVRDRVVRHRARLP